MNVKESFTAKEIETLLNDLEIETTVRSSEDEETGEFDWLIDCKYGEIEFSCMLMLDAPLFDGITLGISMEAIDDPLSFLGDFNLSHMFCTLSVLPELNEDISDEEIPPGLIIGKYFLPFHGGVTGEHIQFVVSMWLEDLFDLYEIETDIENEGSPDLPDVSVEVSEMTIAEQIQWALGDSIKRSARELAEHLMLDKHVINSNLYRYKDLFIQDGGQPPRWTLKS